MRKEFLQFRTRYGVIYPYWLNIDLHGDLVKVFIEYLKSQVGKTAGEINRDILGYVTSNKKLAVSLYETMIRYFFCYSSEKGKFMTYTPSELRLLLFKKVSSKYGGFTSWNERSIVLKELINELGLKMTVEELERYLWSNEKREEVLNLKRDVTVQKAIGAYNFEMLSCFLKYCSSLHLKILASLNCSEKTHKVFSRFLGELKARRILFEVLKEKSAVKILVYGPIDIFNKPDNYGTAISRVFASMHPFLRETRLWAIDFFLLLNNKKLKLYMRPSNLPYIWVPQSEVHKKNKSVEEFKRKIRGHLQRSTDLELKNYVELENIIFVPDILIKKGTIDICMEIIDSAKTEYLGKKLKLLTKIYQKGIKLLVLVNSKVYMLFKDAPFKVLMYEKRKGKCFTSLKEINKYIKSLN